MLPTRTAAHALRRGHVIADLKSSVREAKEVPSGKGTMVAVYCTFLLLLSYSMVIL